MVKYGYEIYNKENHSISIPFRLKRKAVSVAKQTRIAGLTVRSLRKNRKIVWRQITPKRKR